MSKATVDKISYKPFIESSKNCYGQSRIPIMSFCSLLTPPPEMLHLVLGIHRLLIRGVVQLASDKFGSKLNDLASGLKEVDFTRMSVKITALLNTCDSKLTTIANVCSHIAPDGNEGRLLEMRVEKLFEVLFL